MSHIKRFREGKTTNNLKPNVWVNCSLCSNEAHHIHHLDENNKNNKPENLQPLCTLCHSKIHGIEPKISQIKRLIILLNRTQKARIAINNQIQSFSRIELTIPEKFNELVKQLDEQEKLYEKEIKKLVESGDYPTAEWLLNIKGIKHVLAGKILAYIDFSRTKGVGKLWAYAGLTPNSKKMKGKKADWNQELKMICCGQIADSFIKQRTPKYREIYDKEKARQIILMEETTEKLKPIMELNPPSINIEGKDHHSTEIHQMNASPPKSKMHCHKRAIRKMIKEFLKDYYIFGEKTISLSKPTEQMTPRKRKWLWLLGMEGLYEYRN